jgi:hypothetical protein
MDAVVQALVGLVKKAKALRAQCSAREAPHVAVLLGLVDLSEAYRQCAVDTTERWASGFTFIGEHGRLVFGVDERFGFGGALHPLLFCRITNANVSIFDRMLHEDVTAIQPLQARWRRHLRRHPFSLRDGTLHRQVHGRRVSFAQRAADGGERERSADDGEAAWVFRGIKPEDELTHPHPVRQCMVPISPYREDDAARVVAHIDDHLLAMLGLSTAAGLAAAEKVRRVVLKDTFKAEGLPVDASERGKEKDAEGSMRQALKFLGILFDLSDLERPVMGVPKSRVDKLAAMLDGLLRERPTHMAPSAVMSVAGKLVNVAAIVLRGRIHVCGIFAAMSSSYGKERVHVTTWMAAVLHPWSPTRQHARAAPHSVFRADV